MRQYRPSAPDQKRRHSLAMALARIRRRNLEDATAIRNNSEPWAPQPDSIEAAIAVSNQIEALMKEWDFNEVQPYLSDSRPAAILGPSHCAIS